MKVNYECAPCMMRQSCEAIEHAIDDNNKRMEITVKLLEYLQKHFKKNVRSNKLGTDMHHYIMDLTGNPDPYKQLREEGNQVALKLIPKVEKMLKEDPSFANYVQAAVVGNIIDFGALTQDTNMEEIIKEQIHQLPVINDTDKLEEALSKATKILYLTDNGGEIVFDKLLLKKIKKEYPQVEIILALKESPILNDAMIDDAKKLGLDKYTTLISTGAASVGVVEEYISDELKNLMKEVDLIISKGMGNYEGLTEMEVKTPIYFLLNTKCNVISEEIGVPLRSNVIIKTNPS